VLALALLPFRPVLAAGQCVDARVSIDAAHQTISMLLTLPPGVESLALEPFDGYRRSEVLRSPDGSAVISDDGLRAAQPGGRLLLSLDVRDNLPQRDRAYAPFLRFADGTVAFDSQLLAPAPTAPLLCLRFVPAAGQQVVGFGAATSGELPASGDGRQSGYVAFGNPQVRSDGPVLMVFDRETPAWAIRRLDQTFDGLTSFYRRWLPPVAMPTVFIYRMAYPPGTDGTGYHGDRLPASLTLGLLGNDWQAPRPDALEPMTGFIAHEAFHLWNAANGMGPADAAAELAEEGGAEMAAVFAASRLRGQDEDAWLDAATDSLDACLVLLPATGSLADAGLEHGQLPYACGVPVMLALAAANDREDPVAGYFRGWKRLVDRSLQTPALRYRWSDLALPDADPRVVAALRDAIEGDGTYDASLRKALSLAGFGVVPNRHPSASLRRRLNQQLLTALMAQDCDGVVDLWSATGGFRIGAHGSGCRRLEVGRTVVALLGMSLADDDPSALRDAIHARCSAGAKIPVGYADGASPVDLDCPSDLPALPTLWRIVNPARHGTAAAPET
jgi:hypothetical protein